MARKSRKQIAVEEPVIESVSSEVFSTAIYARLSVENSGKSEKVDVIANQIEICKSYICLLYTSLTDDLSRWKPSNVTDILLVCSCCVAACVGLDISVGQHDVRCV